MPIPLSMRRNLSASLPSYFRFHPYSYATSSAFFTPHPEHDDPSGTPAPAPDSSTALTRLEVLKGWELSLIVLSLYAATFLSLIYALVVVHNLSESWLLSDAIPPLSPVDTVIRAFLETASFLLALYFFLNIALARRLTDEQIWTCALLFIGLLATNPFTRDYLSNPQPSVCLIDTIYTTTVYLYLLLAAHSYRVLDPSLIHAPSFYIPKLALAFAYVVIKLSIASYARVSLGIIPFSRILVWITLLSANQASFSLSASVLLISLVDASFVYWLVCQVAITADFLATVPYFEYRSKQLGFRCFVYQTFAFCFAIITLSIVIIQTLPDSYIIFQSDNSYGAAILEPPVARLSLAFVYFVWTVVLAYVNLPPSPLFLPASQAFSAQVLHLLRNSHILVWLGLADFITTHDAEDSSDENATPPHAPNTQQRPVTVAATPLQHLSTVPMRYRHRELFDLLPPTPRPNSSTFLRNTHTETLADMTALSLTGPTLGRRPSSAAVLQIRPSESSSSHRLETEQGLRQRLRLRKNLFVMETQILMANISYLAYIVGNPREELPQHKEPSSDGDDFVFHFQDDDNSETNVDRHSDAETEETQPNYDDGTMFRVNPYAMAGRYGFKVYRYISCEEMNTHAIVLVNEFRVVVSFSGTRDVSNWRMNTNVNRTVLDDRLTRLEYEVRDAILSNVQDFACDGLEHFDSGFSGGTTDGTELLGGVRRSASVDELASERNKHDVTIPLSETRTKSYGSLGPPPRRSVSEHASSWRTRIGRNLHGGLATGRGVSIVASAFAYEFRTFGQAKVHSGFLDAYMSLRKEVLGTLVELYGGRKASGIAASLPLFFCGHSLGGAMAMFGCYEAARYYKRIGIARRQDVACTTFGCPRVGNEAFKLRYERLVETHWRFENAGDPIPNIPTLMNYVPVGVQVLVDKSGMLLIDPSFIEVHWWSRFSNPYLGYRLHVRASYIMALRSYCKMYKHGIDDLEEKFWPFPLRVQTRGLFRQLERDWY